MNGFKANYINVAGKKVNLILSIVITEVTWDCHRRICLVYFKDIARIRALLRLVVIWYRSIYRHPSLTIISQALEWSCTGHRASKTTSIFSVEHLHSSKCICQYDILIPAIFSRNQSFKYPIVFWQIPLPRVLSVIRIPNRPDTKSTATYCSSPFHSSAW